MKSSTTTAKNSTVIDPISSSSSSILRTTTTSTASPVTANLPFDVRIERENVFAFLAQGLTEEWDVSWLSSFLPSSLRKEELEELIHELRLFSIPSSSSATAANQEDGIKQQQSNTAAAVAFYPPQKMTTPSIQYFDLPSPNTSNNNDGNGQSQQSSQSDFKGFLEVLESAYGKKKVSPRIGGDNTGTTSGDNSTDDPILRITLISANMKQLNTLEFNEERDYWKFLSGMKRACLQDIVSVTDSTITLPTNSKSAPITLTQGSCKFLKSETNDNNHSNAALENNANNNKGRRGLFGFGALSSESSNTTNGLDHYEITSESIFIFEHGGVGGRVKGEIKVADVAVMTVTKDYVLPHNTLLALEVALPDTLVAKRFATPANLSVRIRYHDRAVGGNAGEERVGTFYRPLNIPWTRTNNLGNAANSVHLFLPLSEEELWDRVVGSSDDTSSLAPWKLELINAQENNKIIGTHNVVKSTFFHMASRDSVGGGGMVGGGVVPEPRSPKALTPTKSALRLTMGWGSSNETGSSGNAMISPMLSNTQLTPTNTTPPPPPPIAGLTMSPKANIKSIRSVTSRAASLSNMEGLLTKPQYLKLNQPSTFDIPLSQKQFDKALRLEVIQADSLPLTNNRYVPSVYCTIYLLDEYGIRLTSNVAEVRTDIVKDNNPCWKKEFLLQDSKLGVQEVSSVMILLRDASVGILKHHHIGQVTIPIHCFLDDEASLCLPIEPSYRMDGKVAETSYIGEMHIMTQLVNVINGEDESSGVVKSNLIQAKGRRLSIHVSSSMESVQAKVTCSLSHTLSMTTWWPVRFLLAPAPLPTNKMNSKPLSTEPFLGEGDTLGDALWVGHALASPTALIISCHPLACQRYPQIIVCQESSSSSVNPGDGSNVIKAVISIPWSQVLTITSPTSSTLHLEVEVHPMGASSKNGNEPVIHLDLLIAPCPSEKMLHYLIMRKRMAAAREHMDYLIKLKNSISPSKGQTGGVNNVPSASSTHVVPPSPNTGIHMGFTSSSAIGISPLGGTGRLSIDGKDVSTHPASTLTAGTGSTSTNVVTPRPRGLSSRILSSSLLIGGGNDSIETISATKHLTATQLGEVIHHARVAAALLEQMAVENRMSMDICSELLTTSINKAKGEVTRIKKDESKILVSESLLMSKSMRDLAFPSSQATIPPTGTTVTTTTSSTVVSWPKSVNSGSSGTDVSRQTIQYIYYQSGKTNLTFSDYYLRLAFFYLRVVLLPPCFAHYRDYPPYPQGWTLSGGGLAENLHESLLSPALLLPDYTQTGLSRGVEYDCDDTQLTTPLRENGRIDCLVDRFEAFLEAARDRLRDATLFTHVNNSVGPLTTVVGGQVVSAQSKQYIEDIILAYHRQLRVAFQPYLSSRETFCSLPGQPLKSLLLRILLRYNSSFEENIQQACQLTLNMSLLPSLPLVVHIDEVMDWYLQLLVKDSRQWFSRIMTQAKSNRSNVADLPYDIEMIGGYWASTIPETFLNQLHAFKDVTILPVGANEGEKTVAAIVRASESQHITSSMLAYHQFEEKVSLSLVEMLRAWYQDYRQVLRSRPWDQSLSSSSSSTPSVTSTLTSPSVSESHQLYSNRNFLIAMINDCYRMKEAQRELVTAYLNSCCYHEEVDELNGIKRFPPMWQRCYDSLIGICDDLSEEVARSLLRMFFHDLLPLLCDFDRLWGSNNPGNANEPCGSMLHQAFIHQLTNMVHTLRGGMLPPALSQLIIQSTTIISIRYLLMFRDRLAGGSSSGGGGGGRHGSHCTVEEVKRLREEVTNLKVSFTSLLSLVNQGVFTMDKEDVFLSPIAPSDSKNNNNSSRKKGESAGKGTTEDGAINGSGPASTLFLYLHHFSVLLAEDYDTALFLSSLLWVLDRSNHSNSEGGSRKNFVESFLLQVILPLRPQGGPDVESYIVANISTADFTTTQGRVNSDREGKEDLFYTIFASYTGTFISPSLSGGSATPMGFASPTPSNSSYPTPSSSSHPTNHPNLLKTYLVSPANKVIQGPSHAFRSLQPALKKATDLVTKGVHYNNKRSNEEYAQHLMHVLGLDSGVIDDNVEGMGGTGGPLGSEKKLIRKGSRSNSFNYGQSVGSSTNLSREFDVEASLRSGSQDPGQAASGEGVAPGSMKKKISFSAISAVKKTFSNTKIPSSGNGGNNEINGGKPNVAASKPFAVNSSLSGSQPLSHLLPAGETIMEDDHDRPADVSTPTNSTPPRSQQPNSLGALLIHHVAVRGLHSSALFGQANPYVVFTIGTERVKTAVQWNCLEASWGNQTYTLVLDRHQLEEETLLVEVFDKERIRRKRLLGSLHVSLGGLEGRYQEGWYALKVHEEEANGGGEVHFAVSFAASTAMSPN